MNEYQLEAEYLYEFSRNGCNAPAYNSIVAGGITPVFCTILIIIRALQMAIWF